MIPALAVWFTHHFKIDLDWRLPRRAFWFERPQLISIIEGIANDYTERTQR